MGLVQAPRLTVADVLVEFQGLILCQNAHGVDAGVDAIAQREVNDAVFAAKGDSGFCCFFGQNLQSAALTAGQQHSNGTLFLKMHRRVSLLY